MMLVKRQNVVVFSFLNFFFIMRNIKNPFKWSIITFLKNQFL